LNSQHGPFCVSKDHPEQQHLIPIYTFGGPDGPQLDLAKIDGLGRLCDSEETLSNTSTNVDFSYDFVYDMRSQLKQASIEKNSSPYRNAVYNYRKDGNLDVLGFCVYRGKRCTMLLKELRRRGLEDMKLFVSDESVAIGSALERIYPPVSWQHCTFHHLIKLRATIGATDYRDIIP
jgi:hypothetical protein